MMISTFKTRTFLMLAAFVVATAVEIVGQTTDVVLATATGYKFTAADLDPKKSIYLRPGEIINHNRKKFFEQTVSETLLEIEAKLAGTTAEKVLAAEIAKLPRPSEAKIKEVFDANREALGERTLEQSRNQIVNFLLADQVEKAEISLITRLKTKHKYIAVKDINAANLKPTEVLFTLTGKPYTLREFELTNRIALNDIKFHIYEEILAAIEDAVFNKLISVEAVKRNIDSTAFMSAEITDKMRDFSNAERTKLLSDLQSRLFTKYAVKILLPEPTPLVLNVSADDDPSIGTAAAKVTIVTFIDYQCSTCAMFSPTVKAVAAEFGPRVRYVVRDFPLESIHENAFRAALAANAAKRQGKFFEYGAMLYANQIALDNNDLLSYAAKLRLDLVKFKADIADPKNAEEVRKDIADGETYGVNGTPTIFINGVKYHGFTESKLRTAIEKAIKQAK